MQHVWARLDIFFKRGVFTLDSLSALAAELAQRAGTRGLCDLITTPAAPLSIILTALPHVTDTASRATWRTLRSVWAAFRALMLAPQDPSHAAPRLRAALRLELDVAELKKTELVTRVCGAEPGELDADACLFAVHSPTARTVLRTHVQHVLCEVQTLRFCAEAAVQKSQVRVARLSVASFVFDVMRLVLRHPLCSCACSNHRAFGYALALALAMQVLHGTPRMSPGDHCLVM